MPVAYSVYHMQRREDLYGADALTFRPERWEDTGLADVKWGYLPFNGGPRLCLGSESHNRPLQGRRKLTSDRQRTLVSCLLRMESRESFNHFRI
jgi:Cytochrome P450